jgi:hypothetical protein
MFIKDKQKCWRAKCAVSVCAGTASVIRAFSGRRVSKVLVGGVVRNRRYPSARFPATVRLRALLLVQEHGAQRAVEVRRDVALQVDLESKMLKPGNHV